MSKPTHAHALDLLSEPLFAITDDNNPDAASVVFHCASCHTLAVDTPGVVCADCAERNDRPVRRSRKTAGGATRTTKRGR